MQQNAPPLAKTAKHSYSTQHMSHSEAPSSIDADIPPWGPLSDSQREKFDAWRKAKFAQLTAILECATSQEELVAAINDINAGGGQPGAEKEGEDDEEDEDYVMDYLERVELKNGFLVFIRFDRAGNINVSKVSKISKDLQKTRYTDTTIEPDFTNDIDRAIKLLGLGFGISVAATGVEIGAHKLEINTHQIPDTIGAGSGALLVAMSLYAARRKIAHTLRHFF